MAQVYKVGMEIPEGYEIAPSGFLRKKKKPYLQRAADYNHRWSRENMITKTVAFNKEKCKDILDYAEKCGRNFNSLVKDALRFYIEHHK